MNVLKRADDFDIADDLIRVSELSAMTLALQCLATLLGPSFALFSILSSIPMYIISSSYDFRVYTVCVTPIFVVLAMMSITQALTFLFIYVASGYAFNFCRSRRTDALGVILTLFFTLFAGCHILYNVFDVNVLSLHINSTLILNITIAALSYVASIIAWTMSRLVDKAAGKIREFKVRR